MKGDETSLPLVPSITSITRVRALWSGSSSKSHDPETRTHDSEQTVMGGSVFIITMSEIINAWRIG